MSEFSAACPLPFQDSSTVLLAHGGGGKMMNRLIEDLFAAAFATSASCEPHDSAVVRLPPGRVAFTTDTFVVRPLFFPGGNIGELAVCGTVNDLAMSGARPLYLSAGFVLEEGLPLETLRRIVASMAAAARRANVSIVTGDTKVVDRGKGDGVYINTSGIGIVEHEQTIAPSRVRAGDIVLLSGDLGRHGMAVMAVREGLEFDSQIESDTAPLADVVLALLAADIEVHCLRDVTRGGLASVLNEIAGAAHGTVEVEERRIPVREDVRAACEVLGLNPLHVACEGRFVAFVPEKHAAAALNVMRTFPVCSGACEIGCVGAAAAALVTLKTPLGSARILDMLSGEQLPRIC